ncbi:hypothetical protein OIO90_000892 [Microbotryomycetes sp. JL221]|nr:hypothetical protein OIO90_000892 [Microbotryomycetes sp. JL221]
MAQPDPFRAGPGSSVAYADTPSRIGSPQALSAIQGRGASRNSGANPGVTASGTQSAYSKSNYPWYLQTKWIMGLVFALLLALGLGLGLGLGLNARNNNNNDSSAASNAAARNSGPGPFNSGNTDMATSTLEETVSGSVVIVPSTVRGTQGPSTLYETIIEGETVTAEFSASQAPIVTVSETAEPRTSTRTTRLLTVAETRTITSVLLNGESTTTITQTVFRTIVAPTEAPVRRRRT